MAFGLPGEYALVADGDVTSQDHAYVKKLLGRLNDSVQAGAPGTQSVKQVAPDGTQYIVTVGPGIRKAYVVKPQKPSEQEPPTVADLWVPRGFVVYPAWADAPFGVGLPVVADTKNSDPQAGVNLSPGLSRARWTVGGPCGEVLVSPDKNAGYPRSTDIPVPLLFQSDAGPTLHAHTNLDTRAPAAWGSWRLELAPFTQHYPQEDPSTQAALLKAVNDVRPSGAAKFTQRFRGFARVAEMAASIFFTAGTITNEGNYPATYDSAADRTTKEGYPCDWMRASITSFDRNSMYNTQEGRATSISPTQFAHAWTQSAGNPVTGFTGTCALLDVGYRGGYMVATFAERDRWIQAGNACWQSNDKTLPPISWHSFASMNLTWETFPCVWDYANQGTLPLKPTIPFTDGNGDCWMKYRRSTVDDWATYDAALGRHIYCRGRSIALAPNGGLVWAAGVLPHGNNDRLIALVHDPADQPTDAQSEGYTRYLRVWWCDIPKRDLRLDPQQVICGTAPGDPWAWRGGDSIDLGAMPAPAAGWTSASATANSLKYNSVWRFSKDGTRAVCLRDYGSQADYATYVQGFLYATLTGHVTRAVELTFSLTATDDGSPPVLNTSTVFHGYTAGATAAEQSVGTSIPDSTDTWSYQFYETVAEPLAVDYDADNNLMYAYGAAVAVGDSVTFFADATEDNGAYKFYSSYGDYRYLGTGDANVAHATDMTQRVLLGCELKTASLNQRPDQSLVLDVRSGTFATKLFRPRFSAPPAGSTTVSLVPNYPCQVFSEADVAGVLLARNGTVESVDWYPVPDGAVWYLDYPCGLTSGAGLVFVYLPLSATSYVQGMYAERFGQRVFGYQVSPQPEATLYLASEPSDTDCGCAVKTSDMDTLQTDAPDKLLPRGGKTIATVPLPDGDWMMYAKVV